MNYVTSTSTDSWLYTHTKWSGLVNTSRHLGTNQRIDERTGDFSGAENIQVFRRRHLNATRLLFPRI
jgi:hypothetical protein